eukprot:CAMPEP_0197038114 /NCGR_PEP_ID=MMETSP1384-20130603/15128_1 /TAXON_ID=29189 /ORGANISM="Ammonia sp." /LENGTH=549 /DNA_ID=CAMNT_0042468507 /DNA_START=27 /DNA_END=1673 /DNA_ORIENTATION=+
MALQIACSIQLVLATVHSATQLAGIQRIALGYNILQGNPREKDGSYDPGFANSIFVTNNFTENNMVTLGNGVQYAVPNGIHAESGSTCSFDSSFDVITGVESYSSILSESVSASGTFDVFNFGASTTYQHVYTSTNKNGEVMTSSSFTCSIYSAQLQGIYDYPYLDTNFYSYIIYQMPTAYDMNDAFWSDWFSRFGTHYFSAIEAGGVCGQYTSIKYYDYSSYESSNFSLTESAGFLAMEAGGVSLSTSYEQSLSKQWSQVTFNRTEFNIGGTLPSNGNSADWEKQLYTEALPIKYSLSPIYDLLNASNYDTLWRRQNLPINKTELTKKYNALRNATYNYCIMYEKQNPNMFINCKTLPPNNPEPEPSVFGGVYCSETGGYNNNYCVNPYTTIAGRHTAFNCKQGYTAVPYIEFYGEVWYYCLNPKFKKGSYYYDPMLFFGGFYTTNDNNCQYSNAFSGSCGCPSGFKAVEFGNQCDKGHHYYTSFWCYNETSWTDNGDMGIIGGFYQTGHIPINNQFTKVMSCPDGFNQFYMTYLDCDHHTGNHCERW